MRDKRTKMTLAAASAAVLAACGGGGGGGGFGGGIAGIGGTGTGGVSGFASVIINDDKELITGDDTVYTIDGVAVSKAEFELEKHKGLVVRYEVKADSVAGIDQSQAASIAGFHLVKGYVDQVSPRLVVLGQVVQASSDTQLFNGVGFSNGVITGLSMGEGAEVAGFVDANGVIQATRIEKKTLSLIDPWKVVGDVGGFVANTSLTIGSLSINTASAVVDDNCPGGLGNGDRAEVKMTPNSGYNPLLPTAVATKIECVPTGVVVPTDPSGAVLEASIEDFVCSPPVGNRINVGGQQVDLTATTEYEGGSRADLDGIDPTLGICLRVEAEGDLNTGVSPTVLTADKIDFRQNRVRMEVVVDPSDIDTVNNRIQLFCDNLDLSCVTGLEIDQTEDRDNIFDNVLPGQRQLEIRGYADGGNTVFVEEVRLGSSNVSEALNDIRLRGVVSTTVGSPAQVARIIGVNVAVGNFNNFFDENDVRIADKNAALALITAGAVISVEGAIYVPDTRTLEPNNANPADAKISFED